MRATPILSLMVLMAAFLQAQTTPTPVDCQFSATFTASSLVTPSYYNKGPTAPCIAWRLTYATVNATGVSISLQGTNNLPNGTADPAGWTNLTVTAPVVNPAVGTAAGTIAACCDYYPWIRAVAGTFTGTGQTMSLTVLGYKGTSASRIPVGPGAGGPCNLSGSQTTGYVLTATDNVLGCAWQTPSAAVVNINTILAANYCPDTGTAGAIVCTTSTTFGAYAAGQAIVVKMNATNTGATTIVVNSIAGGAKAATKAGATALAAGNLVAGQDYALVYDGTRFQVLNPTLLAADIPSLNYAAPNAATTPNGQTCTLGSTCNVNSGAAQYSVAINEGAGAAIQGVVVPNNDVLVGLTTANPAGKSLADLEPTLYAAGGGIAQAQTVTLAPAATANAAGLTVRWLPIAANTAAAPTLAVNGLTATAITKCGGLARVANDLTTTAVATVIHDGTTFQLQNPQASACGGSGYILLQATSPGTQQTGNMNISGVGFLGSGTAINSQTSLGDFLVASNVASTPRGTISGQWSTDTASARFSGYKGRGTQAVPTTVASGDFITRWSGFAYDGTSYIETASIVASAQGTIGTNRIPSQISFYTSTD